MFTKKNKNKIVKVSSPNWLNFSHEDKGLISFTPGLFGIWGNYKFEINNDCKECEYWVILDSFQTGSNSQVKANHVVLVTTEEIEMRTYPNDYLSQFDYIITSRADINGKRVIKWHYICPWHIKRSYDEIIIKFIIYSIKPFFLHFSCYILVKLHSFTNKKLITPKTN